jgi:hypothetical protein
MDPKNQDFWLRAQAVRSRAALQSKVMPKLDITLGNDPGEEDAPAAYEPATPRDLRDARQPLPPTELAALPAVKDFDLRGDGRRLFEDVARAFGLECEFDNDYQPVSPFRFQMTEVDYRQALHGLEAATASFVVPLTGKRIRVARDNPQKRAELEPHVAVTVQVPETLSTQDFNAMVTAVQQTSWSKMRPSTPLITLSSSKVSSLKSSRARHVRGPAFPQGAGAGRGDSSRSAATTC